MSNFLQFWRSRLAHCVWLFQVNQMGTPIRIMVVDDFGALQFVDHELTSISLNS